ncbi:uncharacterized protein MONBRDRAFT_28783 [Monosiga brevicollis MX1]|uniref:Rhodanese domain-containing protein n=1 Tax=Monosiga brevicollis TaxID=81824 RepID=A9V964_MONBE|nr:uncharacterized protein MONBRDRAFT_28783 [Monosiga brevicollis MX1]EDQ86003.1 predicted protein [Monosiga brevicollis MX1]|eukprot:XP_001749197.1 hypothetical protein [Monosiga brevicollis MX1]
MDPTKSTVTEDGLRVDTYYLECLAQASYLVAHEGQAFLIDPRRDIEIYVKALADQKLTLKGILETHLHADFVSGHMELLNQYGCPIMIGRNAGAKFPHYSAMDGDCLALSSRYSIRALETPGHTFGCVTWVLYDNTSNKPLKAFTGDTLFVGGCGRPDLVGALIEGATPEKLSQQMFHSLHHKLLPLGDDVEVFPAHGPGSPCGKGISQELSSTIGNEKRTNPALQFSKEADFVAFNTDGLDQAPQYFPNAVKTNLTGASHLDAEVAAIPHLDPIAFNEALKANDEVIVLDTRGATAFASGHVQGATNIPLGEGGGVKLNYEDGNFAIWVGTLIKPGITVLLITAVGKETEALQRLGRIGYAAQVKGVLQGGMAAWRDSGLPTQSYERFVMKDAAVATQLQNDPSTVVVDARTAGEFTCAVRGHFIGAINLPLAEMPKSATVLDKSKHYVVYCLGGFRSTIATSILRQHGLDAVDIVDGYDRGVLGNARCHTTAQGTCTKTAA